MLDVVDLVMKVDTTEMDEGGDEGGRGVGWEREMKSVKNEI